MRVLKEGAMLILGDESYTVKAKRWEVAIHLVTVKALNETKYRYKTIPPQLPHKLRVIPTDGDGNGGLNETKYRCKIVPSQIPRQLRIFRSDEDEYGGPSVKFSRWSQQNEPRETIPRRAPIAPFACDAVPLTPCGAPIAPFACDAVPLTPSGAPRAHFACAADHQPPANASGALLVLSNPNSAPQDSGNPNIPPELNIKNMAQKVLDNIKNIATPLVLDNIKNIAPGVLDNIKNIDPKVLDSVKNIPPQVSRDPDTTKQDSDNLGNAPWVSNIPNSTPLVSGIPNSALWPWMSSVQKESTPNWKLVFSEYDEMSEQGEEPEELSPSYTMDDSMCSSPQIGEEPTPQTKASKTSLRKESPDLEPSLPPGEVEYCKKLLEALAKQKSDVMGDLGLLKDDSLVSEDPILSQCKTSSLEERDKTLDSEFSSISQYTTLSSEHPSRPRDKTLNAEYSITQQLETGGSKNDASRSRNKTRFHQEHPCPKEYGENHTLNDTYPLVYGTENVHRENPSVQSNHRTLPAPMSIQGQGPSSMTNHGTPPSLMSMQCHPPEKVLKDPGPRQFRHLKPENLNAACCNKLLHLLARHNNVSTITYTVFCLIRAPGALARSHLIVWRQS